jgi:hypothetical protein
MAGALAALVLSSACTPALDWRDWRPEGSGLTLLLPCKPVPQARQVQLAGQTVRLALHACSAGGQTWGLAFADVGDPTRTAQAMQALLEGSTGNLGAARSEDLPPLKVPGATPHEGSRHIRLAGTRPDGLALQSEVVVFVRGTVVYQATVLGSALPAEAVATFFESLRVVR